MNIIKKHADVVASMEEFEHNYNQGMYKSPWIVYVGNDNDGYNVIYSNDEKSHSSITPDVIESLKVRLEKLESEKVFCYEEEYETLLKNKHGWVTNIDGTRSEVVFDANKMYCIYEDEGPSVVPEEPTPNLPEIEVPEEPIPEEPEISKPGETGDEIPEVPSESEEPRNDEESPRYDEMAPEIPNE